MNKPIDYSNMPTKELEQRANEGDSVALDLVNRLNNIVYHHLNEPDEIYDKLPLSVSEEKKDKPHGHTLTELAASGDEKAIIRIDQIKQRLAWIRVIAFKAIDYDLPEEKRKWYKLKLNKLFPKNWIFHPKSRERMNFNNAFWSSGKDRYKSWDDLLATNVLLVCDINYLLINCPAASYNSELINPKKKQPRKGLIYWALQKEIALDLDIDITGSNARRKTNEPLKLDHWRNNPRNQEPISGKWLTPDDEPDPSTQGWRFIESDIIEKQDKLEFVKWLQKNYTPEELQLLMAMERGEIKELAQLLRIPANRLYKQKHDLIEKMKRNLPAIFRKQ
ncbi:MAG: hypothetical protein LLG42_16490 [Chloroflexi bacterium]|nr:hypothetical protein [Chloroflexota bacterium]